MAEVTATTVSDVLIRQLPALSATSDMPVMPAPTVADAPKIDAEEVEAIETEDAGEEGQEQGDDKSKVKEPEDDLPAYAKREITKARNQRRAFEAEAKQAREALEGERKRREELAASIKRLEERLPQPSPAPEIVARPDRAKFDDPDAYEAAVVEWAQKQGETRARTELNAAREAEVAAARQESLTAENQRMQAAWGVRREAALAEIADYVEIAENPDIQISIPMAASIMQAENGAAIAYHLGKNPAEAERIAKLSEPMQIFEMGRLAATIAAPPPPAKISKAPRPINALRGGQSEGDTPLADKDMNDYAAARERALYPGRFTAKNGGSVAH